MHNFFKFLLSVLQGGVYSMMMMSTLSSSELTFQQRVIDSLAAAL